MPSAPHSPHNRGKVLLINPNLMKPPVAPLALDYLAHTLNESGYPVDVLDLCFATDVLQEVKSYFSRNHVIAVAVSIRNTDDVYLASQDFFIPNYKELIDMLKTLTDAPVILGGSGFSTMPRAILDYYELDYGIWGEGEFSLPMLINRLTADEDCSDVPGLIYRRSGTLHTNPGQYLDLNHISCPARSAIDNRRYFAEGGMSGIESKRGCPMGCIYCADPLGKGRHLRLRSPKSVADEIDTLLDMGIDHFHFCDSEFNIPNEHAVDICRELVARGLGNRIRWYTYATPAGFTNELAALCVAAGCAGINFGVDSGCDRILRRLGRNFTVEDVSRTAETCHQAGIVSMFDLLLGGPGEDRQSLQETIETIKRLSPNRAGISLGVRIFPGTELATSVDREGPLNENPNLCGTLTGNEEFFAPVFYLSSLLGDDASGYLSRLIGKDERFFFVSPADADQNYNYNDNTVLSDAIKAGYRGAFWDILRRLSEKS